MLCKDALKKKPRSLKTNKTKVIFYTFNKAIYSVFLDSYRQHQPILAVPSVPIKLPPGPNIERCSFERKVDPQSHFITI